MWLENLRELKKAKGLSSKQIADKTLLPERTVKRIFSGDTEDPRADTIRRIVAVLGGSLDDIFAESGAVIVSKDLAAQQADFDLASVELELLQTKLNVLQDLNASLTAENDMLRRELKHKDELLAIHNYYNKLKPTE
jgi:transcriptional regulator with XRE-family HTH domain